MPAAPHSGRDAFKRNRWRRKGNINEADEALRVSNMIDERAVFAGAQNRFDTDGLAGSDIGLQIE
jgi:hypothetical protein